MSKRNIFLLIILLIGTSLLSFACSSLFGTKVDLATVKLRDAAHNEEQLTSILKQAGVARTMQMLVDESNGGASFDCHQESHQIGRMAYKIFKEEAFPECNPSCHSGCYHGAMESFLNEKGTLDLAKNVEEICKKFETTFGEFECLHGVGHGILAYLDYDMPEAINTCKELSSSFAQSSCYGGMFMENVLTGQGLGADEGSHGTAWVNDTDPHFPCNKVDQSYDVQYECYQMQTSWMLTQNGFDFDQVARDCLTAPENMRGVCFKSYGRDAAGNSLRDPVKIIELCGNVPRDEDYYDQCMIGAVNVIIDFWGPGLQNQATELCKMVSKEGKQVCYQTLANRLPDIFTQLEPRIKICAEFEQEYKLFCNNNS